MFSHFVFLKNDEWEESNYFLGKTREEVIEKINAKYDAELAALEREQPGVLETPITDLTEKINTFLGNKQELYSVFENAISREFFEIQCN